MQGVLAITRSVGFGHRREAFEADLRQLLHETNSGDLFSEHMQEIAAEIWRR